jgi:hypothetical protein
MTTRWRRSAVLFFVNAKGGYMRSTSVSMAVALALGTLGSSQVLAGEAASTDELTEVIVTAQFRE